MNFDEVCPRCFKHLGKHVCQELTASYGSDRDLSGFPDWLAQQIQSAGLPAYIAELASLEIAYWKVKTKEIKLPNSVHQLTVNPCLQLLRLSWKLIVELEQEADIPINYPEHGEEWVLIWRDQEDELCLQQAMQEDLFALKVVAEGIDFQEAAQVNQVSIGAVNREIYQAVQKGILLSPPSRIRREKFLNKDAVPERFLSASVFSLQWHITNACDLQCKHCYDRSKRSALKLDDALAILDDLYTFCNERFVRGHVSFTGGNPFLYPRFVELYQAAFERGFALSILGNPVPREQLEELLAIQEPQFFQVSLEGLKEHNDEIRGQGHYGRIMDFLALLQELEVSSNVMLTMTKDNLEQVLPLTDQLRDRVESFTFNRLSQVGEGAKLELPDKESYKNFLAKYAEAAKQNPILYYKDNLFNILLYEKEEKLFSGCTGFGCGAAFNFLVVLPDGEAHACRKFPSLLGNVFEQSIADIYDAGGAQKYRDGCTACDDCAIRHVCGGCMAISKSFGQDIYTEKDPHCFMPSYS